VSSESLTKCTGAASALTIRRADVADLDQLTPLFDAYRLFYQQPPDSVAARRFLQQRIERDESISFLAARDGSALGFMQLYPVFSSTALRRLWLLNDLFVAPQARSAGVGRALVLHAEAWAHETTAQGIFLRTAITNAPAQGLYESLGYVRNTEFYRYDRIFG